MGIIPRRLPFTQVNDNIKYFRHAISLDEHRAWVDFFFRLPILNCSTLVVSSPVCGTARQFMISKRVSRSMRCRAVKVTTTTVRDSRENSNDSIRDTPSRLLMLKKCGLRVVIAVRAIYHFLTRRFTHICLYIRYRRRFSR